MFAKIEKRQRSAGGKSPGAELKVAWVEGVFASLFTDKAGIPPNIVGGTCVLVRSPFRNYIDVRTDEVSVTHIKGSYVYLKLFNRSQ